MNKAEFLSQLRAKLAGRMEEDELSSALSYYEEYLEDAGPEREREVLEELGSPEAVAAQVLGEQTHPYTPRGGKRASHTWVVVLCVALGAILVGGLALLVLSFAGYQSYTKEPQVSVSAQEIIEPPIPATPVHREDGEKGYTDASGLAAFSKVTVEVGIGSIVLEEGDEYALSMDWFLNTADMKYDDENGTLKIWSAISGFKNQQGGTVRITVPAGTKLEKVDFQTGLGEIEVRDCTITEKLKGFTGLGSIDVSGDFTGEIDLESGMGDIDVDLDGHVADYELDLEAGLGSVYIQGEKASSHYTTPDADNSLECQTGMGDIHFRSKGK